jgi:hypothetical protein
MRDLKKRERSAIEAVARRFSATWERTSDEADAYLTVVGKRVAVDVATLKRRGAAQDNAAKPRLRFDKVATKLMDRLQAAVGETVPDGTTVLLTVTAPIRLPSKTAASLEEKIQTLFGRGSDLDEKDTIHGNRVRIRLLRTEVERAPRMIGFVHNADSDPLLLLNMTRELLELISAQTVRRPRSSSAGDRWLIAISAEGFSCLEAYRYIYSQLHMATEFKKILMVFGDGRVGMLTA